MTPSDFEQIRFSTAQLAAAISVTPRQLQWWDEKKLLVPSRVGGSRHKVHRRVYKANEALQAALLCELRRKKLSLAQSRVILRKVRKILPCELTGAINDHLELFLVVPSSGGFAFESDATRILFYVFQSPGSVIVVCVTELAHRLMNAAESVEVVA